MWFQLCKSEPMVSDLHIQQLNQTTNPYSQPSLVKVEAVCLSVSATALSGREIHSDISWLYLQGLLSSLPQAAPLLIEPNLSVKYNSSCTMQGKNPVETPPNM